MSLFEKMKNNTNNTNYAFSVVKSYYEKYGRETSSYELISAIRNEFKGLNLDFKPSEIKEFIRLVDEEFKSSQLHKIADDNKKELMAQFCTAYCGILSRHHICATHTTGKYISEATGLEIEKLLTGEHGGEQHKCLKKVSKGEYETMY